MPPSRSSVTCWPLRAAVRSSRALPLRSAPASAAKGCSDGTTRWTAALCAPAVFAVPSSVNRGWRSWNCTGRAASSRSACAVSSKGRAANTPAYLLSGKRVPLAVAVRSTPPPCPCASASTASMAKPAARNPARRSFASTCGATKVPRICPSAARLVQPVDVSSCMVGEVAEKSRSAVPAASESVPLPLAASAPAVSTKETWLAARSPDASAVKAMAPRPGRPAIVPSNPSGLSAIAALPLITSAVTWPLTI